MKKDKKILIAFPIAALIVIAIFIGVFASSGWTADVVSAYSSKAFQTVYEYLGKSEEEGTYLIQSPDGEASFSYQNQTVEMRVDLSPFLAAGLDLSLLPAGYVEENGNLQFETQYSRSILGFHSAMGHFNIVFENKGAFEWAQDILTNDKDIVFSLNPEPFQEAGADVEHIAGWVLGEVEMHENGKKVNELKLLKAFDLA